MARFSLQDSDVRDLIIMIEHGLYICWFDFCIYHNWLSDGSYIHMLLYVDDMLIAAKHIWEYEFENSIEC